MNRSTQYYLKTLANGLAISLILTVAMFIVAVLTDRDLTWDQRMLREFSYSLLLGFVLSVFNGIYIDFINDKTAWEPKKDYYRILVSFAGSIPITLFGIWIVRMLVSVFVEKLTFTDFARSQQWSEYVGPIFITFFVLLIYHIIHLYKKTQDNKVKEHKIIAGTASAQFESLKNQIDPHFLFNSLNVLNALIEENPENAQRFTTSLSKIYRYVLEQKDKQLVNIYEELDFAKTYIKLLKMRFENGLTFSINMDEIPEEGKVIPLALQLLLENTVKHNVVSDIRPLHISIYQEDGYLVVSNNYQKKEVLNAGEGVGLKNIINRYSILTEKKVKIENSEADFRVYIPILTKEISNLNKNTTMDSYIKAKKQVQNIKEFYSNLISYMVVIPGLIVINYFTYWGFKWFVFPMVGWGIGLAIHAFSAFGYGRNWEERKINELMQRSINKENKKYI